MDLVPIREHNHFPSGYSSMNWIDFQDEAEKVQHESALQALSEQFPRQRNLVRALYRQKLCEFLPEARIRAFISIFIIREIKGTLKRMKRRSH